MICVLVLIIVRLDMHHHSSMQLILLQICSFAHPVARNAHFELLCAYWYYCTHQTNPAVGFRCDRQDTKRRVTRKRRAGQTTVTAGYEAAAAI